MNGRLFTLFRMAFLCAMLCAALSFTGALAQEQAYSRIIDVEGIGPIHYYAQNDPFWAGMLYEPRGAQSMRTMLSSGCGPTAAAIAIGRQLTADGLASLNDHAANPERGFRFCACAVNEFFHYDCPGIERASTAEHFEDCLPVILAAYATGNNAYREKFRGEGAGTSITLFQSLCKAYGLEYRPCATWEDACKVMQGGYSVITSVTRGIFTGSSHYLCLAGIHDGYLYILDPFMREEYPDDTKHLLSVVEPGLVRVRLEDAPRLEFGGFYAIGRRQGAQGYVLAAQN